MNKFSLDGFAIDNTPKWVSKKSRLAWAHGAAMAERRGLGATLQELADEYGVTAPTISRILKLNKNTVRRVRSRVAGLAKQAEADQIRIAELKAELDKAKAKADHNEWAYENCKSSLHSVKADLEAERTRAAEYEGLAESNNAALHRDLAASKANEQALIDRLNNGDSWANRWQNEYLQCKGDLEAAEAQIEMMAERLAECRGRGFWARVFNR